MNRKSVKLNSDSQILKEMFDSRRNYEKLIEDERRKRHVRGMKQPKTTRRKHERKTHRTEKREGAHDLLYLKITDIPERRWIMATVRTIPKLTEAIYNGVPVHVYRSTFELENGEMRTWKINRSTFHNLLHEFGVNELDWIGKHMRFRRKRYNIQGKYKTGIIGEPIK